MRPVYGLRPTGSDAKKAFRAATALRRGIATARANISFSLEPVKRRINGPDRYFALRPLFDLLPHRNAVGPILLPQQRQKNDMLKLAEIVAPAHYFYNIDQIQLPGQRGPDAIRLSRPSVPSPLGARFRYHNGGADGMSLKAKLEAVIYAAEEPVTLAQLATLFAGEALEWKAAQQAAAAEQTAEAANPVQGLPLIDESLEYLGLADTPEVYADQRPAQPSSDAPAAEADGNSEEPSLTTVPEAAEAPSAAGPVDPETEAKREARQRDRDIKGVLKHLLDELIAESASDARGVEIREIAGGYRMATKPECHDAVRLFVKSLKPPLRLSLPALETLAVVAYKQPVTAPEVSEIRGVESGGVLGSLLSRKLIATAGRKQVIGRPILYKTTKEFLLRFGLKDLTELPSMEEFEKMAAAEIEEMEPEAVAADAAEDAAEAAEALAEIPDETETPAESLDEVAFASSQPVTAPVESDYADNAAHDPAQAQQSAVSQQESEAVHAEKVQQER